MGRRKTHGKVIFQPEILIQFRRDYGYTQVLTSRILGVSVPSINAYETGRTVPPDTVGILIRLLDGTPELIFEVADILDMDRSIFVEAWKKKVRHDEQED